MGFCLAAVSLLLAGLDLLLTHRLLSSSFLGLPYRILNMNHQKELLRSLWVLLMHEEEWGSVTVRQRFEVCPENSKEVPSL